MMRSPIESLQYQVISPHPLLSPYIGCYWILRTAEGRSVQRELILPDGYAELILNYGASYTWYDQTRQKRQEINTAHWVGERDSSILVELGGGINQVGVKFKPIGLFTLLRQPLDGLANQIASPDELSDLPTQLPQSVFSQAPDEGRFSRTCN
jgi:hypothetical protein